MLERANKGEKILLVSYGNGCDTAVLEATERIGLKDRRGIQEHLEAKTMLRNYMQYLRWRELVPIQPPARPPLEVRTPSPVAQWREVPWELRLTGTKCTVLRHPAVSAATRVRGVPDQGRDGALQLPGCARQGVLLLARLRDARPWTRR